MTDTRGRPLMTSLSEDELCTDTVMSSTTECHEGSRLTELPLVMSIEIGTTSEGLVPAHQTTDIYHDPGLSSPHV